MFEFFVSLCLWANSSNYFDKVLSVGIYDYGNVGAVVKLNHTRTFVGYSSRRGYRLLVEDRLGNVVMKYGGWVEM